MKIFHINSHYPHGSTGRIINDIIRYCDDNAIESFVAFRDGNKLNPRCYKISSKVGLYLHVLLTRLFGFQGFYSILSTLRLVYIIKKIKPDIVHLHNLHGYYLNLWILFSFLRKSRMKIVWTLHDCWSFTGGCAHYTTAHCFKWRTVCHSCPLRHEYYKSYLFDFSRFQYILKKYLYSSIPQLHIVCVSDWLMAQVKSSFFFKCGISKIYNAVDLSLFYDKKCFSSILTKYKDRFIILGVASFWSQEKGLNDYIELSRKITEDEIIVLVGKMDDSKELPNNILSVDSTNSINELADLYSSADVFVNLSYQETFGLVTVEALACGTPAVVYNNTASPELVDETCGIIVETGNIDAIYNAIGVVKNLGKANFSINARKRVECSFSKNKIYSSYLNLYNYILNVT